MSSSIVIRALKTNLESGDYLTYAEIKAALPDITTQVTSEIGDNLAAFGYSPDFTVKFKGWEFNGPTCYARFTLTATPSATTTDDLESIIRSFESNNNLEVSVSV